MTDGVFLSNQLSSASIQRRCFLCSLFARMLQTERVWHDKWVLKQFKEKSDHLYRPMEIPVIHAALRLTTTGYNLERRD